MDLDRAWLGSLWAPNMAWRPQVNDLQRAYLGLVGAGWQAGRLGWTGKRSGIGLKGLTADKMD